MLRWRKLQVGKLLLFKLSFKLQVYGMGNQGFFLVNFVDVNRVGLLWII